MIETGPSDLSTPEGSHALLPCTARGSPKPDVTWEKDGQRVPAAEGKFAVQPSGELLVRSSEVRPRPVEHPLLVMLRAERCYCQDPREVGVIVPEHGWGN